MSASNPGPTGQSLVRFTNKRLFSIAQVSIGGPPDLAVQLRGLPLLPHPQAGWPYVQYGLLRQHINIYPKPHGKYKEALAKSDT
jgi:hypothetical protein